MITVIIILEQVELCKVFLYERTDGDFCTKEQMGIILFFTYLLIILILSLQTRVRYDRIFSVYEE